MLLFVLLLSSLDFTLDGKRLYILQHDIDSEIRIVLYRTLKLLYRLRGLFNVNLLPSITENYYCMKYSLSVSNYHHLLSQIYVGHLSLKFITTQNILCILLFTIIFKLN